MTEKGGGKREREREIECVTDLVSLSSYPDDGVCSLLLACTQYHSSPPILDQSTASALPATLSTWNYKNTVFK